MLRKRRRALVRRYKVPKDNQYFRTTIDLLLGLSKKANSLEYEWAGSGSAVLGVNARLTTNTNFVQFCKQFSYVRIRSISYIASPDMKNQSLNASGFVGLTVWPRGWTQSYGTWEMCADNPFFKVLNPTGKTYKYCNILGGDREWKSTSEGEFTLASVYCVSSFGLDTSTANAPQFMVKLSVNCVFKSPVQ